MHEPSPIETFPDGKAVSSTRNPQGRPAGDAASKRKAFLDAVGRAADAMARLGPGLEGHRDRLGHLVGRLEQNRFHLAVLGQFKRGKSTLINALLGRDILPSAVVPLTAVPTFVRWNDKLTVQVRRLDGTVEDTTPGTSDAQVRALLSKLVTERENPNNEQNIAEVTIGCPASILQGGVVLIDTPGIGSTFRHNTETTHEVLAECDAALFVTSADPPLTEQEASFLQLVRRHVQHLFVVLNKIDYLSQDERNEAIQFLESVLAEQGRGGARDEKRHDSNPIPSKNRGASLASLDEVPIFPLSAKRALLLQNNEKEEDPELAGLAAVQAHLVDFLAHHKEQALFDAVRAKVRDLAQDALLQIQIERKSLTLPIEDLERKIESFRRSIQDISLQRQTASDLLAGDERRAERFVDQLVEDLRTKARKHLGAVLDQAIETAKTQSVDSDQVRAAVADAIPPFFQGALTELSAEISRYVQEVLAAHEDRARHLIETVRSTAADLFDIPYRSSDSRDVFKMDTRLYWHTDKWNTNFSPVPEGATDKLLPKSLRLRRLEKRWSERIESLVLINAETVRWQVIQSLKKAFAHYRRKLDEELEQTVAATLGAIDAARQTRAGRDDLTRERIELLEAVSKAIENLL